MGRSRAKGGELSDRLAACYLQKKRRACTVHVRRSDLRVDDIDTFRRALTRCKKHMRQHGPLDSWVIAIILLRVRCIAPMFLLTLVREIRELRSLGVSVSCHVPNTS